MKIRLYALPLIIVASFSFPSSTIGQERKQPPSLSLSTSTVNASSTIEQLSVHPSTRKHLKNVLQQTAKQPKVSRTILFLGLDRIEKLSAAEAVASELNRPLLKIDVKKVISRYIGETEKNIDSVFHKAKIEKAILFFDEADALFGKRTKVSDTHDRYANQEVSYLLKHMKRYSGLIIVSTQDISRIRQTPIFKNQSIITFPCKHPRNCGRD